MNDISGTDWYVTPFQGFEFGGYKPRALPWAGMYSALSGLNQKDINSVSKQMMGEVRTKPQPSYPGKRTIHCHFMTTS